LQKKNHENWETLNSFETNSDGRVPGNLWGNLPGSGVGEYKMIFHTQAYFDSNEVKSYLYTEIPVQFVIREETSGCHYHIPLLLSPFGYSTYRGS